MAARPTLSDNSFNNFLNDLKKQNDQSFTMQLLQLKYEREIAKEDGDKREAQLDKLIESSEKIEKALTGFVSQKTKEDEKKLSDIKISAQDITWKELGKEFAGVFGYKGGGSKSYTAEKGRYAEEFVKSGKGTQEEGMKDFEKRIKEEKEAAKAELFGFSTKKKEETNLKPTPSQINTKADNIETPAELQNKIAKEDLDLTKKSKTLLEQQLFELKAIREALGGAKPTGKGESRSKPQAAETVKKEEEESSLGLLDLINLKSVGKGLKTAGKGILSAGKGAISLGSKALGSLGMGTLGGAALTAGSAAVAVAGGAAVDWGMGKLGVGKTKDGEDIKIDEAKDEANWNKMSIGQKIQSGLARGMEKAGSFVFLDNIARQARANRIEKESKFLDKEEPSSSQIEATFSEATFAQNDPENYKKFTEFRDQRAKEIYEKDPFSKKNNMPQAQHASRQIAGMKAENEAIKKFKKEIEAAGAGSVQIKENKKDQTESKVQGGPGSKASGNTAATAPSKSLDEPIKSSSFGSRLKEFFGFGKGEVELPKGDTKLFLSSRNVGGQGPSFESAEYEKRGNKYYKDGNEISKEEFSKVYKEQKEKSKKFDKDFTDTLDSFKKGKGAENINATTSPSKSAEDLAKEEAARSGRMGLKAQHEQFAKDAKPGSGYVEPKKEESKSFGTKIKEFFGFGKNDDLQKQKFELFSEQNGVRSGGAYEAKGGKFYKDGNEISREEFSEAYNKKKEVGKKVTSSIESGKESMKSFDKQFQGMKLSQTSSENQAMRDAAGTQAPSNTTVVNNVGSNTPASKFVPLKSTPRPDSSLSRYQDRVAAY